MNLTPRGAAAASSSCSITSLQIVGGRSWATEEGSRAEVMMFPREAIKIVVAISSTVKVYPIRSVSLCAVQTNFAQGWDSMYVIGIVSIDATDLLVRPPVDVRRCCKGPAFLRKAPR